MSVLVFIVFHKCYYTPRVQKKTALTSTNTLRIIQN